jgi:hypothetical protein
MRRVDERRRHDRWLLACPVTLRDAAGRIVLRGHGTDASAYGVRVVGPGGTALKEGSPTWVELGVPNPRANGPRMRIVKMRGEVRRITDIGDWKAVVSVFDTNFKRSLLDPVQVS